MNIGKEMQKAETQLKLIGRQLEQSIEQRKAHFGGKRERYLLSLEPAVRAALRYCGSIGKEEGCDLSAAFGIEKEPEPSQDGPGHDEATLAPR